MYSIFSILYNEFIVYDSIKSGKHKSEKFKLSHGFI